MTKRRRNVGSWLESLALALAALSVVAFLVSAGAGLHLSRSTGPTAASDAPAADTALSVPDTATGPAPRVEVLNGAGTPGLARDATERLRAAGFDVVFFGNAPEPRGLSLVLDRGGRGDAARRATAALGIRDVRAQPNAAPDVDVTVILGKDWPPPPPPAAASESWLARFRRKLRSVF